MSTRIAVIGGGGLRTPLLVYGVAQMLAPQVSEIALYDLDLERARFMARLGDAIVERLGVALRITAHSRLEAAVEGAQFVVSSIRVGGMAARARDERIALDHGVAGQETTGPGGAAMALRTIPAVLDHARTIARHAPDSWLISFTNPAGCITQALLQHGGVRTLGICDTPAELFHRIAWILGEPFEDLEYDYIGLNHLGWIRRIVLRGQDITARFLDDDRALDLLYPAGLFPSELMRSLQLIPTEYVYFYYAPRQAFAHLQRAGASRGEELVRMNADLLQRLAIEAPAQALETYRQYLNRRNASYMKVEGEGQSGLAAPADSTGNPFEAASGYHRIAIQAIRGLMGATPQRLVLNMRNGDTIQDLEPDDVVEVPCLLDRDGPRPSRSSRLPQPVRGLVHSVKQYERLLIRSALARSPQLARLALMSNPIVGDWPLSRQVLARLGESDPEHLLWLTSDAI